MNDFYYIGFYMLRDDENDWVKICKDPPKNIFKAFFKTKKISEEDYVITEIIIIDKLWFGDKQVGDIIKILPNSILNYEIYRDNIEINSCGLENLYIINSEEFKCFYDRTINDLIDKLYNKLENYKNLIGINPYNEISQALNKYYNH